MVLPEGLTRIGYSAFRGCSALTRVTLPNSLTTVIDCAFAECPSIDAATQALVRAINPAALLSD